MKIMKITARPWNNSGTEYTKGVGTLEKAIPVRHYLLFEKWWTDKCRFAWECAAALFLSSSIIFKMQSRLVVRSWATARMSLIVKEDKSSMKNFIESPSFPELSKQARKTNESKEWSIQDGQSLNQWPYIFNIAQNSKKPPEKMEKVKLLWSFSKTLKNWDSFENANPLRIQQSLNENLRLS